MYNSYFRKISFQHNGHSYIRFDNEKKAVTKMDIKKYNEKEDHTNNETNYRFLHEAL